MQTILKALGRRRTALGFGVHSPFAFRFITEVLRPPRCYGYYAYGIVGRDSLARLAVRLLAAFNPATVQFDIADRARLEALKKIAAMVTPGASATDSRPDIRIIDTAERIVDLSESEFCNMLIFGCKAAASAATLSAEQGRMVFTNDSDIAVVAARPHLPFTIYHLAL